MSEDKSPLGQVLARAPEAEFVTLVRLLEWLTASEPLGTSTPAPAERVRLRASVELGFAASDVEAARRSGEDVEVVARFLGLGGATGALPAHMAEELQQEDEDVALRKEFVDVFHHRALSLLYRALGNLRISEQLTSDAQDRWSQRLCALTGRLGPETIALEPSDQMELLPLLLARRSASALQAALRHVLCRRLGSVDVELRELTAKRVDLAIPDRVHLGVQRHALGRTTTLGRTVRAPAAGATLVVRPVSVDAHARLLPGGDLHTLVTGVFALFDRDQTELELELHVEGGTRPSLGRTTRLGRTAWLASRRTTQTVRVAAQANSNATRNAAA